MAAVGYLVSRYPSVTHTFVLHEVEALRALGVRVETATVRRIPDVGVLSPAHQAESARTFSVQPVAPARLVAVHVRAFARSPRAYLRTLWRALRMAHAGGRPRLWQLFYFAEALVLHDWMARRDLHHIHVHHANVSSDLALLACAYANAAGAQPRWTWSLTLHGSTEWFNVASHKVPEKVADAAAVVCISDFTRSQVAAFVDPRELGRLHTVRCGIDVGAFAPPPERAAAPADGGEVLCVAALFRGKGHVVLLDAFAQLVRARPAARLTLVGDGGERATLEAHAAALGLAANVDFLGALGHDRVREFYARADVFCLPSFHEGVPTVLMEAMACELPVVATYVNGTPELVDHEVSGLLVAPARADLLAGALESVLADPDRARAMGRAGRARVERDYDIRRVGAQVREVLAPYLG